MPFILAVNAGSSSLRVNAYRIEPDRRLNPLMAARESPPPENPAPWLQAFLEKHTLSGAGIVAHRIVHGGENLTRARLLDAATEAEIERLAPLAPLHHPQALRWIRASRDVLDSSAPQVAVFDTAYYADLPEVARTYALPRAWTTRHGVRRYGFHGLAHQALWRAWRARNSQPGANGGRVISLHLGAGCSITAVNRGAVKDTSMGFSPLEGLVMATRCGDIDPALVTFLQERERCSPQDLYRQLNEASGLLGVSGVSADMRRLLETNDPNARRAIDLYCYRARQYIGAYIAVLGGVDAILFGGGVGENAPAIRAGILEGMSWIGLRLDAAANAAAIGVEQCISHADSRVQAWVIPVDEAKVLAEEALSVVSRQGGEA